MPPPWKLILGEVIVGTVESYDTYVGKYGESKVCLLKDDAEGSLISVYLSPMVLLGEFTKLRPKVGERVGSKYLGRAGDDADGYHRYKVVVDRDMDVDTFFGVVTAPPLQIPQEREGVNDVPF